MWRSPAFFQEVLNQYGLVGDLYDAIEKDDLPGAVIVAMDILKKTGNIPPLKKEKKCTLKSASLRQQGNKDFKAKKYQKAFENYNKALMFAPKGSEELVLAYSNRSALLATCKMFKACLRDIDTCFKLGCPTQIVEKLSRRREEAMKGMWIEDMTAELRFSEFAEEYLKFNERKNPQISCASIDVGVVLESRVPKVVAARDVKVGKVIAIEKAFITHLDRKLMYSACYYCHHMSINLIPCEGCCSVLFCGIDCQRACINDYHGIECQMIEVLDGLPIPNITVKAALKLRNQFTSWKDFNEATNSIGLERIKVSEINEIFDGRNKFSMLNFKDDAVFKYGIVYNASFGVAIFMHHLSKIKSFLPSLGTEKVDAVRSFSKLLMYYSTNLIHTQTSSTVAVLARSKIEMCHVVNFCVFPFTSKLKSACNPNVLVIGLNNKVALIAVQPLKPGMELTIAYLGHWLDNKVDKFSRWSNLLTQYKTVCACAICNEDWILLRETVKPTEAQLRCLRKLDLKNALKDHSPVNIENIFPKCCKTLAFLSDIPYSNEYMDVYHLFRKCLLDIQDQYTSNVLLDSSDEEE